MIDESSSWYTIALKLYNWIFNSSFPLQAIGSPETLHTSANTNLKKTHNPKLNHSNILVYKEYNWVASQIWYWKIINCEKIKVAGWSTGKHILLDKSWQYVKAILQVQVFRRGWFTTLILWSSSLSSMVLCSVSWSHQIMQKRIKINFTFVNHVCQRLFCHASHSFTHFLLLSKNTRNVDEK